MYDYLGGASMFEGSERSDDFIPEPGAEYQLPTYAFKGLTKEALVTGGIMRLLECKLMLNMGQVFTLTQFQKATPHPSTNVTEWCAQNEKDRDYTLGADVCVYCRDRLTVSNLVSSGPPAVRVVPAV